MQPSQKRTANPMDDYIPLSALNDFCFCPYSLYLHQVYQPADTGLYHAAPQIKGLLAHQTIDQKTYSTRKTDLMSLPVYSESLGLLGKIDLYRKQERKLIERKYRLPHLFKGRLYQLWGQYYCLTEMGYPVDYLAFQEIASQKYIPIPLPGEKEREELERFIENFKHFSLESPVELNPNKCSHCIYSNLCDKFSKENVYQ